MDARLKELVGKSVLAKELSEGDIEVVAKIVRLHRLDDGQVLSPEGEPDSRMHVVVNGALAVSRPGADGQWENLHVLTAGDLAGELSFLDGTPHFAGAARAGADGSVLARPRGSRVARRVAAVDRIPHHARHRALHAQPAAAHEHAVGGAGALPVQEPGEVLGSAAFTPPARAPPPPRLARRRPGAAGREPAAGVRDRPRPRDDGHEAGRDLLRRGPRRHRGTGARARNPDRAQGVGFRQGSLLPHRWHAIGHPADAAVDALCGRQERCAPLPGRLGRDRLARLARLRSPSPPSRS